MENTHISEDTLYSVYEILSINIACYDPGVAHVTAWIAAAGASEIKGKCSENWDIQVKSCWRCRAFAY